MSNIDSIFLFFMAALRSRCWHYIFALWFLFFFFNDSIARSATRRYLIYSEADFEGFRPAGATRCTDGGEIWHGGRPKVPPPGQISPHRCKDKGIRPLKLKFLLRFDQNVEYKLCPAGVSLARFSQNLQCFYLVSGCVSC